MDKMKRWFTPSFDEDDQDLASKKKKTSHSETKVVDTESSKSICSLAKVSSMPAPNVNAADWMKNFDPKTVEDLAVHHKKVHEVESWLCGALRERGQMLLVSGPAGSGKTATVRMLANKYNARLREWITPHDTEMPMVDGKYEFREKASTIFKKFLVDAGCYSSLLETSNGNTVLLIEDYPNIFLKNSSEFADVLQHYRERRAWAPVVFICTECYSESRDSAFNLFTSNLKDQYKIHHISFNSVSTTGLRMALKRVSQIISTKFSSVYDTPSPELIDCVVNSSAGDVRSAVLNLHFATLKGMNLGSIEQVVSNDHKNKKKKKQAASKFQSLGKDESVSLLHAVGRALNPKFVEEGSGKRFTHPPLEIMEQFSTQPASFLAFLHENYPPHFSCAEHAARAAAALSTADCLLAEWREKFCQLYGLYVAVAGLMVANKKPVSAWHPVRGPKPMRVTHLSSRDIPLLEKNQLYNGKVLTTDFKTYCNIINSQFVISKVCTEIKS